jgi:hypothetical protein
MHWGLGFSHKKVHIFFYLLLLACLMSATYDYNYVKFGTMFGMLFFWLLGVMHSSLYLLYAFVNQCVLPIEGSGGLCIGMFVELTLKLGTWKLETKLMRVNVTSYACKKLSVKLLIGALLESFVQSVLIALLVAHLYWSLWGYYRALEFFGVYQTVD